MLSSTSFNHTDFEVFISVYGGIARPESSVLLSAMSKAVKAWTVNQFDSSFVNSIDDEIDEDDEEDEENDIDIKGELILELILTPEVLAEYNHIVLSDGYSYPTVHIRYGVRTDDTPGQSTPVFDHYYETNGAELSHAHGSKYTAHLSSGEIAVQLTLPYTLVHQFGPVDTEIPSQLATIEHATVFPELQNEDA